MNNSMPLKIFVEECTRILQTSSLDDLKGILTGMAHNVNPSGREDFIKSLSPTHNFSLRPPVTLDILNEIDILKEAILEQGEEEPDWEMDDEDTLGGYEQFLPSLISLFEKTEVLFEQGHYDLAKNAYRELFSFFTIEDDYGRGIRIYDVDIDLEPERARYFWSVYATAKKEERASCLLKAMEDMSNEDFQTRPNLREIIDVSLTPLPDLPLFLPQWIDLTRAGRSPAHDAWLREATLLLHGPAGLKELAKQEGSRRPRVYVDWIQSLLDTKMFPEALNAGKTALTCLPNHHPLRAAIGDLIIACGQHLKDEAIQQEGRWISFQAKPTLSKLIELYDQAKDSTSTLLMQQAAEAIDVRHARPDGPILDRSWERDDLERPSRPSGNLLLHALLFSGNIDKAFELAKKEGSLGWSGGPQPFFIAYYWVQATTKSLSHLPPHLKAFWEYALKISQGPVWIIEEEKNEVQQRLEAIYQDLFAQPCLIDPKILSWCSTASRQRVEDIVIHQQREAYEKAAHLTATCTEVLTIIDPPEATKFFWSIQNKFPRHSAFQAQLGRMNAVKLL